MAVGNKPSLLIDNHTLSEPISVLFKQTAASGRGIPMLLAGYGRLAQEARLGRVCIPRYRTQHANSILSRDKTPLGSGALQ